MSFIENAAKPMGFGGRAMLTAMNLGHMPLAAWGLGFLPKEDFRVIADCGCGGGAAVRALLRKYPTAKVYGVDQSELCAKRTCKTNRRAIEDGRCTVFCTDVRKLPFEYDRLDLVTAFETIYFRNNLSSCFEKIHTDANKPFFRKLIFRALQNAKKQCDKWGDYKMNLSELEEGKPIRYEFSECPAASFAKEHGLCEVMPALCNVDYASMEMIHARLVRKTTCVNGDVCDYAICDDKDPYCALHPEYCDEAGFRRNK